MLVAKLGRKELSLKNIQVQAVHHGEYWERLVGLILNGNASAAKWEARFGGYIPKASLNVVLPAQAALFLVHVDIIAQEDEEFGIIIHRPGR